MASVKVTVSNGAGWRRYYDEAPEIQAYIARTQLNAMDKQLPVELTTLLDGRAGYTVESERGKDEAGAPIKYTVERYVDVLGRDYFVCTCLAQDPAQNKTWDGGKCTCKHAESARYTADETRRKAALKRDAQERLERAEAQMPAKPRRRTAAAKA